MKLWKAYKKELTVAARGVYFYIELAVALLVLLVLMMVVKPYPDGHQDEYIYNDLPQKLVDAMLQRDVDAGRIVLTGEKEIKLKPGDFTLRDRQTGEEKVFHFDRGEKLTVPTAAKINSRTGRKNGTVYLMPDEVSMLRMADKTGKVGATIFALPDGSIRYRYYTQGYEPEKLYNCLSVLHTYDIEEVEAQAALQNEIAIGTVPRLNTRQAVVPVYVTFACCLMGFFIVCAYVFLDKKENTIRALLVTPVTLPAYLFSKILLIETVSAVSASLVVLPVMGALPSYGYFYLLLFSVTFAFAALGLVAASFFPNMDKAFGVLYLIMIALMLPAIPYYAGGFDPALLHFLPSYPVLESFKQILQGAPQHGYVLATTAGCLCGGAVLCGFAVKRFRKTLCR